MSQFNREWLSEVPEPPRGRQFDDPAFQLGLGRLEQRDQTELANVWYWTTRLGGSLQVIDEQLEGVRYPSRIAAGFIEELDGAFGIIVYTDTPQSSTDEPLRPSEPRSATITVDNRLFPMVVRETIVERHWCTAPEVMSPTLARATCWVQSPTRGYAGWLMPRHAAVPLNAVVNFSDGGHGWVVDHFGECIDSVVVSSNVPPPLRLPSQACWPVVAGQFLEITDSPGNHQPVTVIDADLNLGVLRSMIFPIRFSTDWTGHAGQSGALIVEPTRGEPAGAYLGVLRPTVGGYAPPGFTAPPPSTGYAQACHQLEAAAGMEFYL
jgi:hypothetical protein